MQSAISKIGVVGASGFIGRALVADLVTNRRGCPRLFGRSVGTVGSCPIEVFAPSANTFRNLECVVHLSGITTSRAEEAALQRVNVDLAVEVATAAAAAGVKRFVFVSSLHVHGKSASGLITPGSPFNPDNAYGRSKAAAEAALGEIAAETGLELVILRPPMVYGPAVKGAFSLLARLVGTGLPLPFGLARGRRSFCSVGNLVSAIRHAAEAVDPAPVLIPADPEDFDARGLAQAMGTALGRSVRLWSVPKTILAAPLAAVGRAEMITSLFEPLQVDRSHWKTQGWRPVETGAEAVQIALRGKVSTAPLLLYVTNSTPYFFSHRIAFAREAARRGFRVALAGGDVEQHRAALEAEEILPLAIPGGARGIDPVGDLRAGLAISAHIRQQDVQVVHASGLKTMFLCALARLGSPLPRTVCIVTGLGSTYINDTPKTRLMRRGIEAVLRPLLRTPSTTAVFQNGDDRAHFLRQGVARLENSLVIKGSGVDTSEFVRMPEPIADPVVVFPARLLKSKGVCEFAEAAAKLSARGVKARFALVGDLDPANPDALTPSELSKILAAGVVEAWGFRTDMAKVFADCHIVCLPSYREGLPKALIEAASAGRPIVTTDVPGCREVVTDALNGFVVPLHDTEALVHGLERLIRSPELRESMGAASRRRAEEEFDERVVVQQTVDLYGSPIR